MSTLMSVAVVVATVFGTEWLVDAWLGEDRRYWMTLAGLALLLLAGALIKASGINEVTRLLRNAVIGAWLRGGLRMVGVETEPEQQPQAGLRWSGFSDWLLRLCWGGSLVGLGMIWTGMIAG